MTLRHHRTTAARLLPGLILLIAAFVALVAAEPASATRYVGPGGSDGANLCLDLAAPCATIRHAIGRSVPGDTIRLAPGTYVESQLLLPHPLIIAGNSAAAVTLDGGAKGTILTIAAGVSATVEGVTLRGGLGDRGGAIRIEPGASLVARRIDLRDNRADLGGAVYVAGGSVTLEDSRLLSNTAATGGAVYLDGSSLALARSEVGGNRAGSGAGVFVAQGSSATVSRTVLSGNIAGTVGGAMHNAGTLNLANSVVRDNQAGARGGGLFNDAGTADLDYTTWLGNAAAAGGAIAGTGSTRLRTSVLTGRGLCDGTITSGGNLTGDDSCGQAANPATNLSADGRPLFGSNAVDGAATGSCPIPGGTLATDIRGEHRPADGNRDGAARCDIGAYEFQPRLIVSHAPSLADGTRFGFRGDLGEFGLLATERPRLIVEAMPGAYRLEQIREPGWKLNGITCDGDTDGGSVFDIPGRMATVDLDEGETIACAFISRPNLETIGIVVRTPGVDNPLVSFSGGLGSFSLSPATQPDMRSGRLAIGAHVVQAVPPSGWRVAAIECAGDADAGTTTDATAGRVGVDLDAGEAIGCAFTLVRTTAAALTIRHETAPAEDALFAFTGDMGVFGLRALSAAARTFTPSPGTYQIHELLHPLWKLSRLECAGDGDGGSVLLAEEATAIIDLDAGEAITCTFGHARASSGTGTITIVQAAGAPDGTVFPFSGTLGDFNLSPLGNASRTFPQLRPGSYSVRQIVPAGWVLTGIRCAGDSDGGTAILPEEATALIDLDEGEAITCTYTGSRPAGGGAITIVHEAIPADELLFRYNGGLGGFSLRVPSRPSRSFGDLAAGDYFVNARPQDGWTIDEIACEGDTDGGSVINTAARNLTIDLDIGEAIICRFRHLGSGVTPPAPTPTPTPTPTATPPSGPQFLFYLPMVR